MPLTWFIDGKACPARMRIDGRLTLGPLLRQFGREAAALIALNHDKGILIDMRGVTEIDSAGLGELVILYTAAAQEGGGLCLLAPGERVVRLLEITRLSGLFPQFAEEASALAWIRTAWIPR